MTPKTMRSQLSSCLPCGTKGLPGLITPQQFLLRRYIAKERVTFS